jgi:hypothetical protein
MSDQTSASSSESDEDLETDDTEENSSSEEEEKEEEEQDDIAKIRREDFRKHKTDLWARLSWVKNELKDSQNEANIEEIERLLIDSTELLWDELVALLKLLVWFAENFLELRKILEHQLDYKPRKDKNAARGLLGEHAPELASLVSELKKTPSSNISQIRFLFESFLYIMKRPYSWAPLYIYTTNSYKEINPAMAQKDFTDADVKLLYEIFTDVNLPVLNKEVVLARCVISRRVFDITHAASFTSYQLTSTTLSQNEGICLESEGKDYIAMHIRCNHVPGLFIGFRGLTTHLYEREVVLCPGVRFEWEKSRYLDAGTVAYMNGNNVEGITKASKGQYVGTHKSKLIFHRNYIARVIEHPILNKFPIEARTKHLMNFFVYVNRVFEKDRAERVNKKVALFISKTKAKMEGDERLSTKLNSYLELWQWTYYKEGVEIAAERIFQKMQATALDIYLPWSFTLYQDHDADLERAARSLRQNAPNLMKMLDTFKAEPSRPWEETRPYTFENGRTVTVHNDGKAP